MSSGFGPLGTFQNYVPVEFDIPADPSLLNEYIAARNRLIASIVNLKENGNYENFELQTGQQWFSTQTYPQPNLKRFTFRKVFDFVSLNSNAPLVANTTYSFAHNISTVNIPTRLYGTATTSSGKYISLPYVDVNDVTSTIQIYATSTQIVLRTGVNIDGSPANTLTQAYIVFEYIKQ